MIGWLGSPTMEAANTPPTGIVRAVATRISTRYANHVAPVGIGVLCGVALIISPSALFVGCVFFFIGNAQRSTCRMCSHSRYEDGYSGSDRDSGSDEYNSDDA